MSEPRRRPTGAGGGDRGRRPRRPARGGRRHRQDRGDGRPLLPPGLRRGRLARRGPRLHLHRQGGGRAAPADPRRARRRAPRRAPSGPRELLAELGGAWVTTIHGFCNRAARRPPGRRRHRPRASGSSTRRRPSAPRARPSTRRSRSSSPSGEPRAARRPVAAFDIDGLRGDGRSAPTPSCAAAARPSRALPEPPRAGPRRGAAARGRGGRARRLEELKRERAPTASWSSGRWRCSTEPRAPARPRRARRAAHRQQGEADAPPTGRRSRRRLAASPRRARAASPTATSPSCCELFSAALRGGQGAARRDRLRGPADPRRAAARAGRDRRAPTAARFSHLLVDEFQDTNRLQLRLIEALRGPRSRADRGRRRAAVDLRLPPRRPRRLPRAARAIEASARRRG